MSQANQIALAERCTDVRSAIGKVLLTREETPERVKADTAYRRALEELLRIAREEECGLYLQVAGELATQE
jgi:hypothetical protein